MSAITMGSRWSGDNDKTFVVIGIMMIEGKSWVHYRSEKPKDGMPSEFSCYEESFLSRFRRLPE